MQSRAPFLTNNSNKLSTMQSQSNSYYSVYNPFFSAMGNRYAPAHFSIMLVARKLLSYTELSI